MLIDVFSCLQTCELDTTLIGHTAAVTFAVFSPHENHEIITVSEDRSFKVNAGLIILIW